MCSQKGALLVTGVREWKFQQVERPSCVIYGGLFGRPAKATIPDMLNRADVSNGSDR